MSAAQRDPGYKETPDGRIAVLAKAQYGLISHKQAQEAGLSKSAIHRRRSTGEWMAVVPGVYRLASAPITWHQRLLAACLRLGPTAVASHRAAAALLQLDGFKEEIVEISTRKRVRSLADSVIHFAGSLPPHDVGSLDGVPVTAPARTLLDLGAVASKDVVELALEDALRKGLTTLARLRWELRQAGGKGRRGARVLRELLADRPPGTRTTDSALEVELFRLIKKAGLPLPIRQFVVTNGGAFVARPDFVYPQALLAIEADSYQHHSGRPNWDKDHTRHNKLTVLGWRVLRVTWEDLRERPETIIAAIKQALGL